MFWAPCGGHPLLETQFKSTLFVLSATITPQCSLQGRARNPVNHRRKHNSNPPFSSSPKAYTHPFPRCPLRAYPGVDGFYHETETDPEHALVGTWGEAEEGRRTIKWGKPGKLERPEELGEALARLRWKFAAWWRQGQQEHWCKDRSHHRPERSGSKGFLLTGV